MQIEYPKSESVVFLADFAQLITQRARANVVGVKANIEWGRVVLSSLVR